MTDEDIEIWCLVNFQPYFHPYSELIPWSLIDHSVAMDRKDYILMLARTDAGKDASRVL